MIMKLLEARTILLKIYQKTRFIINPLVKFVLSLFVFKWINESIGYDVRFTGNTMTLLLSAVCAVLPGGVLVFLAMALSLLHIFKVSMFLAAFMLVIYIVLYAFLMRFAPKQALAVVAIPVLAKYNLHYAVPMVLGCVSNPIAALPCICGVALYYIINLAKIASARTVELNLDDIIALYTDFIDAIIANKPMFVMMVIFTLIVIVIFLIRKLSIDYAFLISVVAGVVVNILGFLIADLKYDVGVNVGKLILWSLISGAVTMLVEYMKRVLDYTAIERVQFEDDDYYYYVKAVPKVNVTIPKHNVQNINTGEETEYSEEESDSEYFDETEDDGMEFEETEIQTDSDSEVRYEEFGDADFEEAENGSDDLSEYGMERIEEDQPASEDSSEPEEYEVDMTLEDEDDDTDK